MMLNLNIGEIDMVLEMHDILSASIFRQEKVR